VILIVNFNDIICPGETSEWRQLIELFIGGSVWRSRLVGLSLATHFIHENANPPNEPSCQALDSCTIVSLESSSPSHMPSALRRSFLLPPAPKKKSSETTKQLWSGSTITYPIVSRAKLVHISILTLGYPKIGKSLLPISIAHNILSFYFNNIKSLNQKHHNIPYRCHYFWLS